MYLTHSERNRLVMGAGMALAGGIAFAAGMAAPLPESVSSPRYELALIDTAGEAFIVDHDLTLADCVNRWPEFPAFTVSCDRDWSR